LHHDHDRQPLNGLDIALRCIDRSIRGMGYAGFETQMLVWLRDRVDVPLLRRAIERLGRRHPVITSRLVEEAGVPPYWQFQRDASPQLGEASIPSAELSAVLDCAAGILSQRRDPASADPLCFHLLHRQGGGDVFLMQYNHTLMDNAGTTQLLRELDQLALGGPAAGDDRVRHEPRFLVGRYLSKIPHSQRQAATRAAAELQSRTLRGRAALLGSGEEDKPRKGALRIAGRVIEPDQVRAIRQRAIAVCGLPSLSMTILAGAFRAVRALGPPERNTGRRYMAGIGLDLNLRASGEALFQNLLGLVAINARPEELADREGLVRMLSQQMRDRLVQRHDTGVMRLAHGFQRRPRHVSWVMEHLLRWSCTVWYAYFGSLDALGPRFAGASVERVHYVGPTWSPMGIGLVANQYGGRIYLQLTYDPELVPVTLASDYLDEILRDLDSFAAG
jgi:hypothetical protein